MPNDECNVRLANSLQCLNSMRWRTLWCTIQCNVIVMQCEFNAMWLHCNWIAMQSLDAVNSTVFNAQCPNLCNTHCCAICNVQCALRCVICTLPSLQTLPLLPPLVTRITLNSTSVQWQLKSKYNARLFTTTDFKYDDRPSMMTGINRETIPYQHRGIFAIDNKKWPPL